MSPRSGCPGPPRVFLGLGQIPADLGPTAATIGVFDGVHRGHQALLGRVVDQARARGITAGAITFDRHPMEIVGRGGRVPMLSTLRQRIALLGAAGMEFVVVLPFTLRLSRMPAEEFAIKVLLEAVAARVIVVGANFRFGHRATGNPDLLAELTRPRGVDVIAVSLDGEAGGPISSTRIRAALAAGEVGTAARLLGRPFAVEGHVIRGEGRGRLLGVPTANLRVRARLALPARGIYAGHLDTVGGALDPRESAVSRPLPAVSSVGVNPQFGGSDVRVEAHLLDFDGDLYDRHVWLSFEHRLRDEAAFPDVAGLVAQMERDIRQARELLGGPDAG